MLCCILQLRVKEVSVSLWHEASFICQSTVSIKFSGGSCLVFFMSFFVCLPLWFGIILILLFSYYVQYKKHRKALQSWCLGSVIRQIRSVAKHTVPSPLPAWLDFFWWERRMQWRWAALYLESDACPGTNTAEYNTEIICTSSVDLANMSLDFSN